MSTPTPFDRILKDMAEIVEEGAQDVQRFFGRLPTVRLQRLPHGEGIPHPFYSTEGAAAADLHAAVPDDEPVTVWPGETVAIPTGFAVAVPTGHEWQIRPRSGLARKNSLMVPNSPGTIDSDYRGEVEVLIYNGGKDRFKITRGMRIAQALLAPVTRAAFEEVDVLPATKRGTGGFGSTGT